MAADCSGGERRHLAALARYGSRFGVCVSRGSAPMRAATSAARGNRAARSAGRAARRLRAGRRKATAHGLPRRPAKPATAGTRASMLLETDRRRTGPRRRGSLRARGPAGRAPRPAPDGTRPRARLRAIVCSCAGTCPIACVGARIIRRGSSPCRVPRGRSLDALAAIGSYVGARAQRAARLREEPQ